MPVNRVRELVKILEQSNLQSLEVAWENFSFKAKKPQAKDGVPAAPPTHGSAENLLAMAQEKNEILAKEQEGLVTSPLVGTVYLAPSPDADPFVRVGELVKKGQTLCVIEAMKIMNEVPAPHSGRVTEIICENAQVIGYGDPIFVVEGGHV